MDGDPMRIVAPGHCIRISGAILILLCFASGCSSLIGLNSVGETSVIDPALAGVWTVSDIFVIHSSGGAYTVLYTSSSEAGAIHLQSRLFKTQDFEILDLVSTAEPDPFQIPTHMWVRV